MKKINFLILILIFSIFLVVSCNSNNNSNSDETDFESENVTTEKFYSEKHGFKINFSGEPTVKNEEMFSSYMFTSSLDVTFMLTVSSSPESSNPQRASLDKFRESGSRGTYTRIVTKDEQKDLDGYPGLYIEANGLDGETKYFLANYFILKDNQLFSIMITRIDKMPTQEEVDNFINSFEFVN